MDDTITRHEFEAVTQRFDAENDRQNHRIDDLEETVKEIHSLTASIEKLTVSVQTMAKAQAEQSERLKAIEAHDGKLWRDIIKYVLTAGVGFLVVLLLRRAGIF